MLSLETLLLLGAAIAPASAFWRMECRGVLGNARIDPIVNPGEVSSHSHAILGSSGFSETSDYSALSSADCTSCLVTQDKSAYWHPSLWFQDSSTGKFELVGQVGGTLAYYLLYTGNGNTNITAFPENFRMIAGDNTRRSYTAGNFEMVDPPKSNWAALGQTTQEALGQRALGFNCLDYSKDPEASLYRHFFPDKNYLDANCPDGIRFELMFPACWNGKDLDSDNHRSHVAYPDLVMNGDCPDGFPVRFPGLFYETIWDTASFSDRDGEFVISNGDVSGFAYHGDFMMGWTDGVLQDAVNTCTNPSGEISDCGVFDIQSESDATSCKLDVPSNLKSETATSGLDSLPGGLTPFGSYIGATMLATYDSALASAEPTGIDGTAAGGSGDSDTTATATSATASATSSAKTSYKVTTSSAAATTATTAKTSSEDAVAGGIFATVATTTSTPAAATTATSSPSSSSSAADTIGVNAGAKAQSVAALSASTTLSTSTLAPTTVNSQYISTEYVTANGVVTEVLWEEATVYVTEGLTTLTVTASVVPDETPAVKAREHLHNHARRHGHGNHNHAR